jgi:hypothetical protein
VSEAVAQALCDLAGRLQRLRPDRHDPERFHIERGEIVERMYRLAEELGHPYRKDSHDRRANPKAPATTSTGITVVAGRMVRVERRGAKPRRPSFAIFVGG